MSTGAAGVSDVDSDGVGDLIALPSHVDVTCRSPGVSSPSALSGTGAWPCRGSSQTLTATTASSEPMTQARRTSKRIDGEATHRFT